MTDSVAIIKVFPSHMLLAVTVLNFIRCFIFVLVLGLVSAVGCSNPSSKPTKNESPDSTEQETSSNENESKSNASASSDSNADEVSKEDDKETQKPIVANSDWMHFRGPDFRSATAVAFPTDWNETKGQLWKSGLPGRGASTPVVANGRVYLTAYDGFGLSVEEAGDFRDLKHHVLCFELESGECLWQRVVKGTSLLQKMNPELARHGFASSSIATDGDLLFAYFGVTGLFAFDRDGQLQWQRNLGLQTHYFGSSASPILFENLVIVNASIESRTVYAFDKKTGAIAYMIPEIGECWSTPVLGKNDRGEPELVISSRDTVAAFDPATGKKLWHCKGIQDYVVSVPVIVDGICYLTGGKQKQTIAVRLGGSGDVEKSHKLYDKAKLGSNVSSPVYYEGRLYIVHDNGIMQIIDAKTGDLIKRQRTATRTRPFASPLLAGNQLWMPFQDAGIGVYEATADCEEVSVMPLPDGLPLMASLVAVDDQMLIRNDQYLYCMKPDATEGKSHAWAQPEDFAMVETIESYNINPEKQWSRRYLGFVTPNFGRTIRLLLMPYKSVITDEQTEQAREIIRGEKPKYDELMKRYESLHWEELKAPASEGVQFHERYAALEKEVKALNSATRILVKKLFSKEQMDQHNADAKAGKAHIKPGAEKE